MKMILNKQAVTTLNNNQDADAGIPKSQHLILN